MKPALSHSLHVLPQRKLSRYFFALSLLLPTLLYAAEPPVPASEPAASAPASLPEVQAPVEITAIRDPAIMPYQRAYQMMTRLQALDLRDVRISLRVLDAKSRQVVPDLQISLEGKESRQKVKISETGEVSIPIDAKAYAEGAEFIANKRRKTLLIDIQLFPVLNEAGFAYSAVADSSAAATRALKEIIPWYYRLFMPNPKGVAICYSEPRHQLEIRGRQNQVILADQELSNEQEKTVYCAKLAANSISEASVVPEPGWHAQFY